MDLDIIPRRILITRMALTADLPAIQTIRTIVPTLLMTIAIVTELQSNLTVVTSATRTHATQMTNSGRQRHQL